MKRTFKFYKDKNSLWYVDLPEWTGEKWELQMVWGADTLLELMAQGEDVVHTIMATEPFEGCNVLNFDNFGRIEGPELGEGSWYHLSEYKGLSYNLTLWLCDVTKFVFGDFPKNIYFS
jgi:hypothetical protein